MKTGVPRPGPRRPLASGLGRYAGNTVNNVIENTWLPPSMTTPAIDRAAQRPGHSLGRIGGNRGTSSGRDVAGVFADTRTQVRPAVVRSALPIGASRPPRPPRGCAARRWSTASRSAGARRRPSRRSLDRTPPRSPSTAQLNPLSLRTNWSDAARISSSVAGGSKLKSVLMFRHIVSSPWIFDVMSGLQRHLPAADLFDDGKRHVDARRRRRLR